MDKTQMDNTIYTKIDCPTKIIHSFIQLSDFLNPISHQALKPNTKTIKIIRKP